MHEGKKMATNFRIYISKHKGAHHIKLVGDFDGSSAFELVNMLESNSGKSGKITVDTSGLFSVLPFGVDVFKKNFALNKRLYGVAFTGKYEYMMN
jgi:hypothetical protein